MGKKSVSVQPIREYIMDVMRFEHPIKSAGFFFASLVPPPLLLLL